MAKVHATTKHKIKISDLLKTHLKPHEKDTGVFVYEGDITDEYIAKMVGDGLNGGHVARVRQELYGALYRAPPAADEARFQQLELAVTNLIHSFEELSGRHDKLCQTLALNRVADVKHLAKPAVTGK